jgi:hypothetical protein
MEFNQWFNALYEKGRHPSTLEKAQWFSFEHLPRHLQPFSRETWHFAAYMIDHLPDGPQLTLGLQHLIDAKDCFVRQATTAMQVEGSSNG